MKSKINICQRNENNTLSIVDEKTMTEHLDEETLEVYVVHKGKRYNVEGNCYMAYIVL